MVTRSVAAVTRRPGARWQPALLVAVLILAVGCAAQDHAGHHEHRFKDAERWARAFDDPERDAWQKPDEVIRALALPPDAVVADIGSGTGYFAVRLARAVPRGHVYGADLEPDMVKYLAERGRREAITNLTAVQAAPDDPRLPRPVDLVLLVDTYHHVAERPAYFARLRRSLKPDGRVAIIGSMLELGPSSAEIHERSAAEIVASNADIIIATGAFAGAFERMAQPVSDRVIVEEDPITAYEQLRLRLRGDELILLKGSRGVALERLLPLLSRDLGVPHPHGEAGRPGARSPRTDKSDDAQSEGRSHAFEPATNGEIGKGGVS